MQLRLAASTEVSIIGSRLIARTPTGDLIWPRRLPLPGEMLSDYLFDRQELQQGEAVIQMSTLMIRTAVLRDLPLRPLPRHQD